MWVRARVCGVVLQCNVVKTGAQARVRARTKRYGYKRMDADRRTEGGGRRRGYASMRVRDGDEPVDVGRHTPRGVGVWTRKYVCAWVRGRASAHARGYVGGMSHVYAYRGDGNRDIRIRKDVPMGRWMQIGLHGSVDGQLGKNHS